MFIILGDNHLRGNRKSAAAAGNNKGKSGGNIIEIINGELGFTSIKKKTGFLASLRSPKGWISHKSSININILPIFLKP